MPSQKGRDPLRPEERETTQSRVQEGVLAHDAIAQPMVEPRREYATFAAGDSRYRTATTTRFAEKPLVEPQPMPKPTEKKERAGRGGQGGASGADRSKVM